jgi:hypothetical protein
MSLKHFCLAAALIIAAAFPARAAEEPPLALARDGYFYVGGRLTTIKDKQYMTGQMYVEYRGQIWGQGKFGVRSCNHASLDRMSGCKTLTP